MMQIYLYGTKPSTAENSAGLGFCTLRVISGPQSRLLSRLITLVEAKTVEQGVVDKYGILNLVLLRYVLPVGEGSAMFLHGGLRNDAFLSLNFGIYFFFLRLNEQEVIRAEITEWVARDPSRLDGVQASILVDARITGYSYVLRQAHLHAIITVDIAKMLQARALACYLQTLGEYTRSWRGQV
jgi:hypothetical protein